MGIRGASPAAVGMQPSDLLTAMWPLRLDASSTISRARRIPERNLKPEENTQELGHPNRILLGAN